MGARSAPAAARLAARSAFRGPGARATAPPRRVYRWNEQNVANEQSRRYSEDQDIVDVTEVNDSHVGAVEMNAFRMWYSLRGAASLARAHER